MFPLWMYWESGEGRPRPDYLDLCSQTVGRHLGALPLRVLDESTVFEWLPDLDPGVWHRLPSPVQRSDYARTRLLHDHGGLWLDFDCIVVADLAGLVEHLDRNEVVSWGREAGGRFYNNLFAARPGAKLLGEWLQAQDGVLKSSDDWTALPWAALGQDLTSVIAPRHEYHDLPLAKVAPVMWYEWRRFKSRVDSPARVLAAQPYTVMLWNKVMGRVFGSRTREELLGEKTLLSRLLRIALGLSSVEQENGAATRLHGLADLRFSEAGRSLEYRSRRLLRLATD